MNKSATSRRGVHRAETPRRPARTQLAIAAALALVVVVATIVWLQREQGTGLAGMATVTASSTASGFAPANAVQPNAASSQQPGWRSANGDTLAWLELSWSRSRTLHRITITRNALSEPGATQGLLSFGDGSMLQVRLSTTSPTTVVPLTPRTVNRVRFTVSAVTPDARAVTLDQFLVNDKPGDDDVAVDGAPGGNAAIAATITQSPNAGPADPRTLQDGSEAAGAAGAGADWTDAGGAGSWVQLDWARPRELSSIEIAGSARPLAHLTAATLSFDDGSTLPVGAVQADPSRPTVVAFLPRVTRWVRLRLDGVSGPGPVALAELRAYQIGATPARSPAQVGEAQQPTAPAPCVDTAPSDTSPVVVRCPTTGSAVDGTVPLSVAVAPGYSSVTATVWPADPEAAAGKAVAATPDPSGAATLAVDTTAAPPGPFTVDVMAVGEGREAAHVYFQLYRRGTLPGEVASSPAADGRTLVYSEEFDKPVSLSRSGIGADYAAAKPDHGGAQDFGAAIFADPSQGFDNMQVVDDHYLRINVEPTPAGYADPLGYGRTHLGGMLASARVDGSGFAAQYGYFEARMLTPAAPGTWPAFWMLPSDNVTSPTPTVAEIDAVELYGHDPKGGCQSTHGYEGGKDSGLASCGQRQPTERAAMAWHTYGVSVLPTGVTFLIDGRVIAAAPQVKGGSSPLFFMVDLALGGGWPVDMQGVQDRASLYVDYIRVYV